MASLVVAPEGPRHGYDRDLFPHWTDDDRDRCDTREEVPIAESLDPAQVGHHACRVLEGHWRSAYDGVATDRPEDIDHVVALAEGWDGPRRRAVASDLDHPEALTAVTVAANRAKGDADPAEWQPPDPSAWCAPAVGVPPLTRGWMVRGDGVGSMVAEGRGTDVRLQAFEFWFPGDDPSW